MLKLDTEFMYTITTCAILVIVTLAPFILAYLQSRRDEDARRREADERKREYEEKKLERIAEYDARRNREEDLCVLLGNILKADTAMDYVGSRGGNAENRYAAIQALLAERVSAPPAKSD